MLRQVPSVTRRVADRDFQVSRWSKYRFSTGHKLGQEISGEEEKQTENSSKTYGGKGRWMRAWEIHSYGTPADLQLTQSAKVPIIRKPSDVIVQVKASSLNPIDVMMTTGYGAGTINILRHFDSPGVCDTPSSFLSVLNTTARGGNGGVIEFPLTLGRDFSGIITEIGNDVKGLQIGDHVMGVLGVQRNGSHADFVVTSSDMIKKKPRNLNFLEAASLPYVGLTTWSAIHVTGGYYQLSGKKFLVLGGSGGVGTFAIQYLRACGAYVVSTCSPDAINLLSEIGCHFAVDYKDGDYLSYIQQQAPFDCILDLSGASSHDSMLKFLYAGTGQYITLSPPFASNIDKYGVIGGFATNLNDIFLANAKSLQHNQVLSKWAFFIPCTQGLETLTSLADSGKVKPIIQEIFKFEDLPKAYEKLGLGHSRGKIVIDFS